MKEKEEKYHVWDEWSWRVWLLIILLSPVFWLGYIYAAMGGEEDGFIPMSLLGSFITSIVIAVII